jgi:hypothetical protein
MRRLGNGGFPSAFSKGGPLSLRFGTIAKLDSIALVVRAGESSGLRESHKSSTIARDLSPSTSPLWDIYRRSFAEVGEGYFGIGPSGCQVDFLEESLGRRMQFLGRLVQDVGRLVHQQRWA